MKEKKCPYHHHDWIIPSVLSQLKNKWSFENIETGRVSSICKLCEYTLKNSEQLLSSDPIQNEVHSTSNRCVHLAHKINEDSRCNDDDCENIESNGINKSNKINENNGVNNAYFKSTNGEGKSTNGEGEDEATFQDNNCLDFISSRSIQCLSCPVLLCPKHFHNHEHHLGLEIHYLYYYCNYCGQYFKSLHSDAVEVVEQIHNKQIQYFNTLKNMNGQSTKENESNTINNKNIKNGSAIYTSEILNNLSTSSISNQGVINNHKLDHLAFNQLKHLQGMENVRRSLPREKSPGKDDKSDIESYNGSFGRRHYRSRSIVQNNETSSVYIRSNNGIEPFKFFLRGFVNMGNTCFMNAILQSLIHNPLLRNYIIAFAVPLLHDHNERYENYYTCLKNEVHSQPYENTLKNLKSTKFEDQIEFIGTTPKRKRRRLNNINTSLYEFDESTLSYLNTLTIDHEEVPIELLKNSTTIGLALQRLIQESYTPSEDPIVPDEFLYVVWKSAGHMAGYRQQDAHEFLMAVLNGLESFPPYSSVPKLFFKGQLESRLYCSKCHYTSSKIDPIFDISLQMKSYNSDEEITFTSLDECLQRFTRQELLENEYKCTSCQSQKTCTKCLSIEKLPPIVCFHMKRFEANIWGYTGNTNRRRNDPSKIDHFLDFPLELDLFPYTSSHIHNHLSTSEYSSMYELFAVVEHFGGLNSGHYICYIKRDAQWYECDDELVTLSSESQVIQSHAYILFYVQKNIEYTD